MQISNKRFRNNIIEILILNYII